MVAALSAWPWSKDHRQWRSWPTCNGHVAWEKLSDFYSCKTASNNLKCSYGFKSKCSWSPCLSHTLDNQSSLQTCYLLILNYCLPLQHVILRNLSHSFQLLMSPCCLYCTYLACSSSVPCYCWIQRSSSLWEPGLPKPYCCIHPLSIWPTPGFSLCQFLWNQ